MLVKEFIHVLRDRRLRILLFLPPLVQLVIYGYAVNFDIQHVRTAILDEDRTPQSRQLISRLGSTAYFDLNYYLDSEAQARALIDQGRITILVRLPKNFAKRLKTGETASVQVVLDGTDSNQTLVVLRYLGAVINDYAQEIMKERMQRLGAREAKPAVEVEHRIWFNENLDSRWSFVPGVIAMVVMLVSLMLTALAVVREKEIGTMEQLLVSPLRPVELILGKTVPFVIIALADVVLVTVAGVFWFEVPLRGSLWVLLLGTVLFLFNSVGLGLLISTLSSTQQQAMTAGTFILTPAILLSGLIFPIANMPQAVQYLTYLNPLRYFILVVRGIFLKGVGVEVLWPQFVGMGILGLALLGLSVLRFKRRLG
ncbi:MAG: ABC transporter permease [Desulfarculus sp.]|nr:ABC transporter permease [Desulfarculus sp.]